MGTNVDDNTTSARLHIDWTRCEGRGLCTELLPTSSHVTTGATRARSQQMLPPDPTCASRRTGSTPPKTPSNCARYWPSHCGHHADSSAPASRTVNGRFRRRRCPQSVLTHDARIVRPYWIRARTSNATTCGQRFRRQLSTPRPRRLCPTPGTKSVFLQPGADDKSSRNSPRQ